MIFVLRALVFSLAGALMTASAVVLAFVLNSRMVAQSHILFFCGLYVFAAGLIAAYPLFKLYDRLGSLVFRQKNVYGGSFARLRK